MRKAEHVSFASAQQVIDYLKSVIGARRTGIIWLFWDPQAPLPVLTARQRDADGYVGSTLIPTPTFTVGANNTIGYFFRLGVNQYIEFDNETDAKIAINSNNANIWAETA